VRPWELAIAKIVRTVPAEPPAVDELLQAARQTAFLKRAQDRVNDEQQQELRADLGNPAEDMPQQVPVQNRSAAWIERRSTEEANRDCEGERSDSHLDAPHVSQIHLRLRTRPLWTSRARRRAYAFRAAVLDAAAHERFARRELAELTNASATSGSRRLSTPRERIATRALTSAGRAG
jgi:hypothetical protein